MKHLASLLLLTCFSLLPCIMTATVPETVNYQGTIEIHQEPYTGVGLFRFAIVDTQNHPWTTLLWSNDGEDPPAADVTVDVYDGRFSVELGASPQIPVPASIFDTASLYLVIWFNDSINGVQRLEPNQALTSVAYAFHAANAGNAETVDSLDSSNFLRNDQSGVLTGNLSVTGNTATNTLITDLIKASDDHSVATIDFDTLPNNAQNSGITIGKLRAATGQNNGQPYLWLRGNGAHSWILDHTTPGTLWAQSIGAYYQNVKQGNIGFFGEGPTVDYLSIGFGGYAWWNEQSRFIIWNSGRAEFMPGDVAAQESLFEPSAWLVLAPGQSTANSAPLKFKPGDLMTTPEAGSLEYDGDHLYFTDQTITRHIITTDTWQSEIQSRPKGYTGTQKIVTHVDQDPITGKVSVKTQTLHIENGIIVDIN